MKSTEEIRKEEEKDCCETLFKKDLIKNPTLVVMYRELQEYKRTVELNNERITDLGYLLKNLIKKINK